MFDGEPFQAHRGFTLVELLAACAIIAILAVLLLPSLKPMIDTAKAAKCASMWRQFGAATAAFAADHNGVLPNSTYGSDQNGEVAWFLAPYLVASRPGLSATQMAAQALNTMECNSLTGNKNWRYAFNSDMSLAPVARFTRPSTQIWGLDMGNNGRWITGAVLTYKIGDLAQNVPKPHRGGINVLYLDGHVETCKVSRLFWAQVTRDSSSYKAADETLPISSPQYDQ